MPIIARFYPNGEFSHGTDTTAARKQRRLKERTHDPIDQECRDTYLQWKAEHPDVNLCIPGQSYISADGERLWVYKGDSKWGVPLYDCINSKGADTLNIPMDTPVGRLIGTGALTPLVHQVVESSAPPKKPSRKTLETMTSNMARNIRNAAYVLEVLYQRHNLSFITVTLPGLSTNDLEKCCDRWDEIVDNFLHTIRKRVKKHKATFEYVYCTEIQPQRLEKRGEYAPHLHIVMRGRNGKKNPWYVSPAQVRSAWGNAIAYVVGHGNFDRRALENIQQVRKSAAGYISKYMSKGVHRDTVDTESPVSRLRTQWGGMARAISRKIRQYTRRITSQGQDREFLLAAIKSMDVAIKKGCVAYYKKRLIVLSVCDVTGEERGLWVGCGRLSTPTLEGGLDKLRSLVLSNAATA